MQLYTVGALELLDTPSFLRKLNLISSELLFVICKDDKAYYRPCIVPLLYLSAYTNIHIYIYIYIYIFIYF